MILFIHPFYPSSYLSIYLSKVHFDGWGRIVGSYTSNYLLEKSRVTSPEKGARLATLNTSLPLTDPLQPLAAPYSPYTPYSTVHPLQASAATISSICFSLVSLLQSCRRLRPPTPSIMHMHCTCTAHALHMHYTCTAHALHMHMHCTCTAHAGPPLGAAH